MSKLNLLFEGLGHDTYMITYASIADSRRSILALLTCLQHLTSTPSYCELPIIICTHRPAWKCQATQVASSWVAGPLCLAAQREGGEVLVALHGLLRQHSTRGEMEIDETLTSIWLKTYSETKTYSSETKSILWKPRIIRKPNSKGLLPKPRILREPKSLHSKPKHAGGGFFLSSLWIIHFGY